MRLAALLSALPLLAQPAAAPSAPRAELKVGTGIEKMELVGEAAAFTVPAGTKLYAWARIHGAAEADVTFQFTKGATVSRQTLKVPRSPYRTNAYRTFRAGDEGQWTVSVLGPKDAVLGTATFTVAFK